MVISSSWNRRALVIGRLYPTARRLCSRLELLERALDLTVHVERLESLARAPLVAGEHQLADLRHEPRVVRIGSLHALLLLLQQARQLGVNVERRPATANEAFAARHEHLSYLQLTLGTSLWGVRRGRGARDRVFAFAGDAAASDLVVGAAAPSGRQRHERDDQRERHEPEQREGQRVRRQREQRDRRGIGHWP